MRVQCAVPDLRSRSCPLEVFRVMGDLEWRMMQVGNWLIALICGSMGVFCLWFSFSIPKLAPDAAGFLALAIVLELASHFLLRAKKR